MCFMSYNRIINLNKDKKSPTSNISKNTLDSTTKNEEQKDIVQNNNEMNIQSNTENKDLKDKEIKVEKVEKIEKDNKDNKDKKDNKNSKDNQNNDNKENQKEKKDNNKDKNKQLKEKLKKVISYFSNKKIVLALIVLILILVSIFAYIYINKNKQSSLKENINKNTTILNTNDVSNDSLKIKYLEDNIYDLEQKLSYNDEYIRNLENKIEELSNIIEIQKKHLNSQNINKVKLLIDIQKSIQNDKNYSSILAELENLDKNNDMQEDLSILQQYKNDYPTKEYIYNVFNKELINFLNQNNILKNSQNSFAKFLSNFVVIRKINNTDKNSQDEFILQLETSIKKEKYVDALNLLKDNSEYQKYFSITFKYLSEYILLNDTIDKMINNFTINEND